MEQEAADAFDESILEGCFPSAQNNLQVLHPEAVGTSEDLCSVPERLPFDILNRCYSSHHVEIMDQATACDYLKMEENLKSEDLINNNKRAFEQECLTNQTHVVTLEDASVIEIQQSIADNLEDSTKCSYKNKEHPDKQPHRLELRRVLPNHSINKKTDIAANNERERLEHEQSHRALSKEIKTLGPELQGLFEMDLLKVQQNPEDQEETNRLESRLDQSQKENQLLEVDDEFNDKAMSASQKSAEIRFKAAVADSYIKFDTSTHKNSDSNLTLSTEAQGQDLRVALKAQDLLEDLCNHFNSIDCEATPYISKVKQNMEGSNLYMQGTHSDLKSDTRFVPGCETEDKANEQMKEHSMEYLDLLVNNTPCQSEQTINTVPLDLQTEYSEMSLQNDQVVGRCEKERESEQHQPLGDFTGKSVSADDSIELMQEEIDIVEEENNTEKEESREGENIDGFLHYHSSQDRLDSREKRHQYVSDRLDPDVLHLLEMHLRKQQLVDIKEEREEELLDLHVNEEKLRTECFKSFRNMPPVLDMVLEEPELEHTGEVLEEFYKDSNTPSEIDSDDSDNICAMERNLFESLEHDLMSKTGTMDKHEIATIFKKRSPDVLLKGHNDKKVKEEKRHHNALKNTHKNGIQTKEKETQMPQVRDSIDLQMKQATYLDDRGLVSDIVTECIQEQHGDNVELQTKEDIPNALNKSEEPQTPPVNYTTESADEKKCFSVELTGKNITESVSMGAPDHCCQPLSNTRVDLSPCVLQIRDLHVPHNRSEVSRTMDIGFTPHAEETKKNECSSVAQIVLCQHDVSAPLFLETDRTGSPWVQGSKLSYENCPSEAGDLISESPTAEGSGGVDEALRTETTTLTDPHIFIKVKKKKSEKINLSGQLLPPPDELKTLRINLEGKILTVLEKANAADSRSSRLQAEAELLWKLSKELKNECKSLSKEAAQLLMLFRQQGVVHRPQLGQGALKETRGGEEPLGTSDTKQLKEAALSSTNNTNKNGATPDMKIKGEDHLRFLSRRYNFLQQEAPDLVGGLNSLQHDLRNFPQLHSKPLGFLYNLLWSGLIIGGAMLLLWWSTEQLG
ncbi:uncharacterized protein LOC142471890 [Ascaphus truei]|uniref:uncharacterized protein LOC142471890 n=1 Tax=Ascaphus truei TaxID=8439 RepID=UPI003F5AA3B7